MRTTYVILIFLAACSYRGDAARRNRQQPWSNMNVGALSDQIFGAMGGPINRNNRGNPNGRHRTLPPESPELNLTVNEIIERYPWIQNPTTRTTSSSYSSSFSYDTQYSYDSQYESSHTYQQNNFIAINEVTTSTETVPVPPSSSSPTKGVNPPSTTTSRPKDGRTRFNNPRYLRDRLNGLNRDNYDFRVTQGVQIGDGKYKVKLNQDWRKLPVYGTSLVLEQESDTNLILESADGDFLSGIEEDISSEIPSFNKDEAIARALEHNHDQYQPFQNAHAELMVDTIGDTALLAYRINYYVPEQSAVPVSSTPNPTQPPMPSTTKAFPRWRIRSRRRGCQQRRNAGRRRCISVHSTAASTIAPTTPTTSATEQTPPSSNDAKRPWVLMNAKTGHIYRSWDGLARNIQPGPTQILIGNDIYGYKNYTEVMYKDASRGDCYLQRPLGRGKYLTVNDLSAANRVTVHKFKCSDGVDYNYDRTNGAGSPRNSAFKWGTEAINFIKRTSGTSWTFHVNIETHHESTVARWNGVQIQLGDGDPDVFYPFTTPDTVTHEMAHAFTEHNSRLEYESISGAINEAYSDMAAVAFMDYYFPQLRDKVYGTGYVGIKFNRDPNYNFVIRDICEPRTNRRLQYNAAKPIIISALDYENRRTGLHNASALYSKAFCLLSKTPSWTIQQAFKVFTNANAIYWRPRETFNSAACGVKKAAYDYKNTDQSAIDVDNAFAAVDIACDNSEWKAVSPAPSS